ncbi:MAG: hypothetical protein Q7T61_01025 [Caulobacter sp.]|nr:hypothetical protein [Caulobacter sp.]
MTPRDLKSAYRSDEPMTLEERAEAQREIVQEYRQQWKVYGGFSGQPDREKSE